MPSSTAPFASPPPSPTAPATPADRPRPTTIIEAPRLARRLGVDIVIASETFQRTGSFKFRAGFGVASHVPHPHIIAASSGNFGQALSYAASLFGKRATIVMPANSARVKVDAVREFGGEVDLVDVTVVTRAERVAQLAREFPEAYIASAYDDPFVIQGNSTLGDELLALDRPLDVIVAPIGGGGLTSGMIAAVQRGSRKVSVMAGEPLMANDAARSLREGRIVSNEREPQTIADGARSLCVGTHNWALLKDGLAGIVEVPEEKIAEAVRLLFVYANLKAEPTGALGVAAVLTDPARFRDRAVCCVVTGGNVDPAVYRDLLAG